MAESHPTLTFVADQVGRPTWTRTLAEFVHFLIGQKAEYGNYHLSNEGSYSWYEFAKEISKDQEVEITPVTSAETHKKQQDQNIP